MSHAVQGGDTLLGCVSGDNLFQPFIETLRPGVWCMGSGVATHVGHQRLHVVIAHPAADDQHPFIAQGCEGLAKPDMFCRMLANNETCTIGKSARGKTTFSGMKTP